MQRNPIINHFAVLNIEPTTDIAIIRKAYKNLMMEHHPDKGGNLEKCKEIIAAWDFLKEEDNRKRNFNQFNPKASSTEFSADEFIYTTAPTETKNEPTDALINPNGYFTVFIPILLSRHSKEPINNVYGDDLNPASNCVSAFRFIQDEKFDYEWLLARLNKMSEKHAWQVGADMDEVFDIINQHSFYKYARSIYGIEARIKPSDLYASKKSEKEFSNALNAGSGEYFMIKAGTQFTLDRIKSVGLCIHNDDEDIMVNDKQKYLLTHSTPELNKEMKETLLLEAEDSKTVKLIAKQIEELIRIEMNGFLNRFSSMFNSSAEENSIDPRIASKALELARKQINDKHSTENLKTDIAKFVKELKAKPVMVAPITTTELVLKN